MATLTIIVGLPGSGKSHLVKTLRPTCKGVCEEDFMAHSYRDDPDFRCSRHFGELVRDLARGVDCIIADITFCRADRRAEFESLIKGAVPNVTLDWQYFTNNAEDAEQCKRNVARRARSSTDSEKQFIQEHHQGYKPPVAATIHRVWRPAE
jgi:hypothetical protein